MDYCSLAIEIFARFVTDFTRAELERCVRNAYASGSFPQDPAPVVSLSSSLNVLELWHGPTSAFKDMALQILPEFLSVAIKKNEQHRKVAILTATSGDTGKAALAGFQDAENVKLLVFYPENGVSEMQKQADGHAGGAEPVGHRRTRKFRRRADGRKKYFYGRRFCLETLKTRGYTLSSANSINIGRLLPQIVYYFTHISLWSERGASPPVLK